MRLIDADELVKDIEEYQKSMIFDSYSDRMHFDEMIDFAVDHLEEAPTIDAALVTHARWIVKRMAGERIVLQCSACQNNENDSAVRGKYCWNCGAKMDAKEKTGD